MCLCVWHWFICKGAFGLGFFPASVAVVVVAVGGIFVWETGNENLSRGI